MKLKNGAQGNDTRAIGVRLRVESIDRIKERAARKGWTFNQWMNWAVRQGLRDHHKSRKEELK